MDTQTASSPPARQTSLGLSGRLRLTPSACLPVRYPGYECGLCADACPVAALTLDTREGPAANADCIGCGQCAAVCPSSALVTDGFALPPALSHAGDEIHVDCWRVAAEESTAGTVRVPCLGGITVGWLLSLHDLGVERGIHLIDRGHCRNCPAGSGINALLPRVTEARTLLFQAGVAIERLPALTSVPSRRPPAPSIPATSSEVKTSRRGFLRELVGSAVRGSDEVAALGRAEQDPIVLRDGTAPLDQLRTSVALQRIAERHGRPVPSQSLPQVTLGNCSAHGICARVCPTGALQRIDTTAGAELRYQAARCIACGQCARICPDKAIRVQPSGGHPGTEVLAAWTARQCVQCGESYFGDGGDTCPACRKNQQLLQGMAAMFRPPA